MTTHKTRASHSAAAKPRGRDAHAERQSRQTRSATRGKAPRSGAAARRKDAGPSPLGEALGVSLNCLGILAGLLVIALSVGVWYGSGVIVGILEEVGEHDFSAPMQRLDHYGLFFDSLPGTTYEVVRDSPKILVGKTSYLWRVTLRGTGELRVFRWQHDLELTEVVPLTNPALLLDMELGYITEEEAQACAFYNPQDHVTQAIVSSDFSVIQPTDLAEDPAAEQLPEGPVGAPVVSPEEAAARQAQARQEEKEEGEEEQAVEDEATEESDEEATEVVQPEGGGGVQYR